MSDRPNSEPVETVKTTSTVITAVLLGAVIGSAVTFASITACGYTLEKKEPPASASAQPSAGDTPAGTPAMPPGMPGGMPPGGMPGMPGRGGPPMGMMGAMGGGGGGFGGGGFGGPNGKRDLTQLVGKLELLTRGNVRVELDADQSTKIAAKLAELDKAENMTADEAQKQFEELKGLLTASQNEAIDAVGLPFGGRGGRGGGGGGGGGFGGGGGGRGGMMGRGGPGGGSDDDNPFRQDANQKRLQDMLARLKPAE